MSTTPLDTVELAKLLRGSACDAGATGGGIEMVWQERMADAADRLEALQAENAELRAKRRHPSHDAMCSLQNVFGAACDCYPTDDAATFLVRDLRSRIADLEVQPERLSTPSPVEAGEMTPETILAYAMFDAENTTRLSEEGPGVQGQYIERAEKLLYMLCTYRPAKERAFLAAYLSTSPVVTEEELARVIHEARWGGGSWSETGLPIRHTEIEVARAVLAHLSVRAGNNIQELNSVDASSVKTSPAIARDGEVKRIAAHIFESVHWGKPITDTDDQTRDAYVAMADMAIQLLDGMRCNTSAHADSRSCGVNPNLSTSQAIAQERDEGGGE